jgi:hypothetical protein
VKPLVPFVVLVLALALASPAAPVPVELRYRNTSPTRAYDALDVCRPGAPCALVARRCAAGATCAATAELPPGSHVVTLYARAGTDRSAASNVRTIAVAAPEGCRWDLNGDGVVTFGPSDFAPFLAGYSRGTFTTSDFGAFMRASGTACR